MDSNLPSQEKHGVVVYHEMLESYAKHPPLLVVSQDLQEQLYIPNMVIYHGRTCTCYDASVTPNVIVVERQLASVLHIFVECC